MRTPKTDWITRGMAVIVIEVKSKEKLLNIMLLYVKSIQKMWNEIAPKIGIVLLKRIFSMVE